MRQIVDDHFTKNYEYYKKVCFKYYKGNKMAEELLHEAYLHVYELSQRKPETIIFYEEIGKLNTLFLWGIKNIYQHKDIAKYHEDGKTSALYEIPSVEYEPSYEMDFDDLNPLELERQERKMQRQYDHFQELKELSKSSPPEVDKKKPSEYLKVQVFCKVNEPGMSQSKLAKDMGVSRTFISMVYKAGQEHLQKQIR